MAEMGLLNKYALTNLKTVKHSFPRQMIRLVGRLSIQISERLLVNPCRLQNTLEGSSSLANMEPSKRAWFPNPGNIRLLVNSHWRQCCCNITTHKLLHE